VPKRRIADDRIHVRAASVGGALASRFWARAAGRPVDSFALLAAVAVSLIIVVNAMFLQSGMHPAPFFTNPKAPQLAGGPGPAEPTSSARPAATAATPQPAAMRRDDAIADLIGPSPRIAAVQRALSDYGYGQIRPNGMLDDDTSVAIEKFERERKMPVTGEISDRLVGELSAMVGHPLQ
jgi:alpha-beta hydrolase superfamily lysophospholipase